MIIAATGHRPQKLGGFTSAIRARLYKVAREFLALSPASEVVSGMALGFDMAVAVAALDLGLPLYAAVPHRLQAQTWPPETQELYKTILRRAQSVEVISEPDDPFAYQLRNEFMVDYSHRIVALWNGDKRGGTANCIRYAHKKSRHIDNLWRDFRGMP